MKNPYLVIIFAAGHFKQTKKSANVEMLINVFFSILFVYIWGLNGVALGTILAMFYRVIYCSCYLNNNVIFYSSTNLIKKIFINLSFILCSYCLYINIDFSQIDSFLEWVELSLVVVPIVTALTFATYSVFFRNECRDFLKFIKGQLRIST